MADSMDFSLSSLAFEPSAVDFSLKAMAYKGSTSGVYRQY